MSPTLWKRKIGEHAWNHLRTGAMSDECLARTLDRAIECGWRAPEVKPRLSPGGTAVFWPEGRATTTPVGLLDYYRRRGSAFMLLRLRPLIEGCGPLLLPRLQEVLHAYETQCDQDGIDPVVIHDRIFVGSDAHVVSSETPDSLRNQAPPPQISETVTISKAE